MFLVLVCLLVWSSFRGHLHGEEEGGEDERAISTLHAGGLEGKSEEWWEGTGYYSLKVVHVRESAKKRVVTSRAFGAQ